MELPFKNLKIHISQSLKRPWMELLKLAFQEPSGWTYFPFWNMYQAGFQVQFSKGKPRAGEKLPTQWPINLSVMCKNNWYSTGSFLKAHGLIEQWFYRKMGKLRRPWQQASLSVSLTRAILDGPGKRGLRKMWLLLSTQASGVHSQSWVSRWLLYRPPGRVRWRWYCEQKKRNIISLIPSLDCIIRPNTISGDGTLPWGAEESSSRNWRCRGPKSSPWFSRSSFLAIYRCCCERIDTLEFSSTPW